MHKPFFRMPKEDFDASLEGRYLESGFVEDLSMTLGSKDVYGKTVISDLHFTNDKDEVVLIGALCTVDFSNNIVTTAMQNGKGTVKELISTDDMGISIGGHIMSDWVADLYPYDNVSTFYALFRQGVAFKVSSKYLNMFGITQVVVKSMSFPQEGSYSNTQKFSLDLLSDQDVELVVTENAV